MSKEAMTLALDVLESVQQYMKTSEWYDSAITALREALAEQPAQRCPLCNYQHGHAIGCKNNPVDIALNKMAENARELGLDYEPAQQEPVVILNHAHGVYAFRSVKLKGLPDGEYDLYTSPPAQRTWVGLTDEERIMCRSYDPEEAVAKTEAKLKEKNT